ncbi:SDR family oxidoreductase [Microbacterium sp. W4I20]|uniref:SDR family oxidoreductase n=1 Tax=Microbacterium sp. W4I20 TaxID=3042262 RepID=UPI00278225EC|nr:SDR family oxidoreductase [Microbacterium sp. W4I20]MDQ0726648.1 2-deoxy-D-gluconate 3-dehydrogenase [Microbacterium sp. W4I20]
MSGPFDLTGRLAVVTGASRGIGRAIAESLADAGADIIAVSASIDPERSAVGDAVAARGRAFEAFACDFADPDAVAALGARLGDRPVDILVNNAGTIRRAPAAEHPSEWWDEVIQVDLSSQFAFTQALAQGMLERGRGRIIFTASLLAFQGGINVPGYAAAKSAIAGLTKALSNEWAARGVTVNAIAPGYIATDNTQALQDDPERSRSILERIPAGRWGAASDIGGAAVFLAAPASDYVSGITLPVDGGWLGR